MHLVSVMYAMLAFAYGAGIITLLRQGWDRPPRGGLFPFLLHRPRPKTSRRAS